MILQHVELVVLGLVLVVRTSSLGIGSIRRCIRYNLVGYMRMMMMMMSCHVVVSSSFQRVVASLSIVSELHCRMYTKVYQRERGK
jgi:hypothetical protein